MKSLRRSLALFFTALVVLTSGVFSFSPIAHAEGLGDPISPLRQNEPVIVQVSQDIQDKQVALNGENDQITQLLEKKQDLSQQLQDIQNDVKDLKQKIAEKKAEAQAEQERLDAIKNMFVHIDLYAFDSAGNLYAPGNCTWYAKSRRPDLPNNLGNANTWYATAAAEGWSVGIYPKKGAVATTTAGSLGHVAYVEGVSLDGKWVTISEMNYNGLYAVDTRTVYYTEFNYIYQLD